MTELEALAKDCIENHTHRLVAKPTKQDIYLREESIFIQGYRQSEKRIAELEKQIEELKAENELIKNSDSLCKLIGEQKLQIEKMKCCENCGWYYLQQHWKESKEINKSRMFHCGTCGNKNNWKPKEIKERSTIGLNL